METIKSSIGTLKSNILGSAIGGAVGYFAAKKLGKVENKWALIALTIAGAVVGGTIQAKVSAKSSAPKAANVK